MTTGAVVVVTDVVVLDVDDVAPAEVDVLEDVVVVAAVVEVVAGGVDEAVQTPFKLSEAITELACGGLSPRRSGTNTVLGNVSEPLAMVTVTVAPFSI